MRLLVFSDTHQDIHLALSALESIQKVDGIIHLGDYRKDAADLHSVFPDIPMHSVLGNGDYSVSGRYDDCFELEGLRFFITHGHLYRVKSGIGALMKKAQEQQADVCLFGHTHKPFIRHEPGILLFNPGSARMLYGGTYGIIEIEDGRPKACIMES